MTDQDVASAERGEGEGGEKGAVIVVNGTEFEVPDRDVSYDEVARLAYPGFGSDPNVLYTVLYRKAENGRKEGALMEGDHVKVLKRGTSFNVTSTVRS